MQQILRPMLRVETPASSGFANLMIIKPQRRGCMNLNTERAGVTEKMHIETHKYTQKFFNLENVTANNV